MKKIVRLFGVLLLAALLFSTMGGNAFAANGSVQIEADNQLTVSVGFNNLTEADQDAKAKAEEAEQEWFYPVCDVTVIESNGSRAEIKENNPVPFLPLFASDTELLLTPPEGYYISNVTLTNESGWQNASEPILNESHAYDAKGSTAVSLLFGELLSETDGYPWLDGKWLSAEGSGGNYVLSVTCDTIPNSVPGISYHPGIDLGGVRMINADTSEFWTNEHTVYALTDEAKATALSLGKSFIGYEMLYANGSTVPVSDGEPIHPYIDVKIVAQWKDVPKPEPEPEPEPEPIELPTFTIKADSGTREYNGQPLQVSTYTVDPNPENYGYNLKDVVVVGSVTEPNKPTANVIQSYIVTDEDGVEVQDQEILSKFITAEGTLTVNPRSVTVTAVTCTLSTNGEEKFASQISTQDGVYTNGYHVDGLLENHQLTGDFVTGHSKETFDTDINLDNLHITVKGSGEDLTNSGLYSITTVPGKVTVNNVSPTTPPDPGTREVVVTLKSGTWTYDGKAHQQPEYEIKGLVDGDKVSKVNFKSTATITNVGTASNDIENVEIVTSDGQAVPNDKYHVTSKPGTLTVNPRSLKVSAISCTISTNGEEKFASQLSTQDGVYKNGYHAEGLLENHELVGDFVIGQGKTSFDTGINSKNLRIQVKNSKEDVTAFYNITTESGRVTINEVIPEPTVYDIVVTLKSGTWTYDGKAHHQPEYEISGLVDGDKVSKVNFKSSSVITDVGSASNDIDTIEIVGKDGKAVPKDKYRVTSRPGTLKVSARNLTVTAISGSLTSNGGEIVASKLESPDHEYKYGYKAEGLASGHTLSGDFVQGKGTTGFQTWIDINKLTVLDGSNHDVTDNYNIHTVDGYITVNINSQNQPQSRVYITVTAKSGSFVYDGNPHTMNEYTVSGLVDGDKVDKVTFKTTSTITNVGTQANEIQSVVIKTAAGAAVDSSKYSITYVPGKLTVTKFPLTLTAVSDSKTYDGKALNNKSVKSTALANSDHKLSADYEVYDSNGNSIKNGPVDVGVYVKKVSNIKITSGTTDVTSNYDITTEDGTLTIRTASGGTSANTVTNTAYYGNTYTIRSDAPYSEFQYLMIDGQKVSTDNYTVKEGSTVVTLKAGYIQSLKTGNHNYSIVSTSKQVDGTFNVSKAPKTSDGTGTALWFILLTAILLAAAVAYFFLRRSSKGNGKKPAPTGGRSTGAKSASVRPSAAKAVAGTAAAQYGSSNEKPVPRKKPVSDTVMDFETFFGADADTRPRKEEESDPTKDLLPDFKINLDDYRGPVHDSFSAVSAETMDSQDSAPAAQEAAPDAAEAPQPEPAVQIGPESIPVSESALSQETIADDVPADPAAETAPAAASSWYVGRHEASVPDSPASGWYRPQSPADSEE